ncbi:unnamed protein product, partial [Hymenolepis diminuta]
VEFTTLPLPIKGVLCALGYSRKCQRVTDRVAVKCGVRAEVFPPNRRSIFLQRGVEHN